MNDETKTPETEELRREITEARGELGDTVEALARKADVKAQAKEKVAAQKEKLLDKQPTLQLAAVGILAFVVVGWMIAKRR